MHRWDWLSFEGERAAFRVVCSGGTYVRTLAHDLGASLGCGASLETLRRTRSEPFGLERAITLTDVDAMSPDEVWARAGWSLEQALEHLPTLALEADDEAALGYGARPSVSVARAQGLPVEGGLRSVVLRAADGRVVALGELRPDPATPELLSVCAHVVFPWAVRLGKPERPE